MAVQRFEWVTSNTPGALLPSLVLKQSKISLGVLQDCLLLEAVRLSEAQFARLAKGVRQGWSRAHKPTRGGAETRAPAEAWLATRPGRLWSDRTVNLAAALAVSSRVFASSV